MLPITTQKVSKRKHVEVDPINQKKLASLKVRKQLISSNKEEPNRAESTDKLKKEPPIILETNAMTKVLHHSAAYFKTWYLFRGAILPMEFLPSNEQFVFLEYKEQCQDKPIEEWCGWITQHLKKWRLFQFTKTGDILDQASDIVIMHARRPYKHRDFRWIWSMKKDGKMERKPPDALWNFDSNIEQLTCCDGKCVQQADFNEKRLSELIKTNAYIWYNNGKGIATLYGNSPRYLDLNDLSIHCLQREKKQSFAFDMRGLTFKDNSTKMHTLWFIHQLETNFQDLPEMQSNKERDPYDYVKNNATESKIVPIRDKELALHILEPFLHGMTTCIQSGLDVYFISNPTEWILLKTHREKYGKRGISYEVEMGFLAIQPQGQLSSLQFAKGIGLYGFDKGIKVTTTSSFALQQVNHQQPCILIVLFLEEKNVDKTTEKLVEAAVCVPIGIVTFSIKKQPVQ